MSGRAGRVRSPGHRQLTSRRWIRSRRGTDGVGTGVIEHETVRPVLRRGCPFCRLAARSRTRVRARPRPIDGSSLRWRIRPIDVEAERGRAVVTSLWLLFHLSRSGFTLRGDGRPVQTQLTVIGSLFSVRGGRPAPRTYRVVFTSGQSCGKDVLLPHQNTSIVHYSPRIRAFLPRS